MRARASDVLIVIVAKVFFTDWPIPIRLSNNCGVLQVLNHLILRARLNLEWADTSLLLDELAIELRFFLLEFIDAFFQTIVLISELIHLLFERRNFLFTEAKQVLVTIELKLALATDSLFGRNFLLQLLLLILELVLDALNVQFQLLFNLDVVPDFGFILLEHLLVLRGGSLAAEHRLRVILNSNQVITFLLALALLLFASFVFSQLLLLLHFHVHEDLDAGLDVLEDGEWVGLAQSLPLLRQDVLIVGVNLHRSRIDTSQHFAR